MLYVLTLPYVHVSTILTAEVFDMMNIDIAMIDVLIYSAASV